jgi:hypothetical protein
MRDLAWRLFHRQSDDALGDRGGELGDPRGSRLVAQEAFEPLRRETLLPSPDAGLGFAGLAHDRVRAKALGAHEHDLRAPHVLLRRVAVFDQRSKPIHVQGRDTKGNAGSHPADSHAEIHAGIPYRIQTSDFIH